MTAKIRLNDNDIIKFRTQQKVKLIKFWINHKCKNVKIFSVQKNILPKYNAIIREFSKNKDRELFYEVGTKPDFKELIENNNLSIEDKRYILKIHYPELLKC